MTADPPASSAHPASGGAIGRYLRCPACFKTVTGSGDVCPFCGAALTAVAVNTAPVTLPKYDIVGGCLLAVMLFLSFVVYLLWLLE
jgi:hypothetical protein